MAKADKVVANSEELPYCCGIEVFGNFESEAQVFPNTYNPAKSVLALLRERSGGIAACATTTPDQKEAIKALKRHGFKAVRRWRGQHRRQITLWFKKPKRQR